MNACHCRVACKEMTGGLLTAFGRARERDRQNADKKKPGIKVPGKFIREASRLGDVGPLSGPWVSRAGRPAKTEKRSGRKLCTAMRRSPLRFD
ncbi:hypothetical protein TMES_11775 [Thalassospira mesophila]|uniref:Uncharacterized protein n=1 Tax=Thalassospira mesophila TaxID=1293891 RepID=A0A1Y2L0G7_9PROT|nr:hypothetical protein TMES_11775 [Thalassospira mesophila]